MIGEQKGDWQQLRKCLRSRREDADECIEWPVSRRAGADDNMALIFLARKNNQRELSHG